LASRAAYAGRHRLEQYARRGTLQAGWLFIDAKETETPALFPWKAQMDENLRKQLDAENAQVCKRCWLGWLMILAIGGALAMWWEI
jgi:hypothetical protein